MNERDIFIAARHIPGTDARSSYLEEVCGGDPDLRRRVENLLQADDQAGSFLAAPAAAFQPTAGTAHINETPGAQIGPYKLLQVIGEGGMGVVYMAEQTVPVERRVALKIIKPGMDTRQVIARFEAERQALAMMDHPNIAKVFDAGTTESGRPYFVMELVRGIPITKYCDEHQLTLKQRLELFLPVCHAVQHAHQKGIIHRDLKPTNVLVAQYDDKPVPKVIDFGVAKAAQKLSERTMFTEVGQVVGTLEYMSPEQAKLNQLDIDTRSDIYSLGVLLYELLTGCTPFDGQRLRSAAFEEMLRIIREEEPPRPSTRLSSADTLPSIAANRNVEPAWLRRTIRGELDWIVMKALEKDRNRRYETANAFAFDLQHYLHDEPVAACPPSAAYRFRKFARRNQGALAIASTAILAVVIAMVGLVVSNVLITQQKNLKDAALKQAKINEDAANEQKVIAEQNAAKAREQERIAAANEETARANENLAKRNETSAKANEQLANRRFYAAQMNLAMQAWRAGEVPRVLELLEGQRPGPGEEDLRGFEWYYLWRLCNSGQRLYLHGHTGTVLSVAYSPDGATLASASWDGTVRLWDSATGKERMALRGHSPWSIIFSPDGKTFASSGKETGSLILWDTDTGKPLHTIAGSVCGLAFAPDSSSIAGGLVTESGVHAKLWDVASGAEQSTLADAGAVIGFLPDGKTLVTGLGQYAPNGEIRLWDLKTGSRQQTIPTYWDAAALSPDGARVATSSAHRGVEFWDTATGMQVARIPVPSRLRGLAFSPDGKSLAGGNEDRTVTVWEIETGRQLKQDVHLDPVWGVAFSRDGKTLASSTLAGVIKLWDMTPPEEATTITNLDGVRSLRFDSNGRTLLVGNSGPTKDIDVAAGKEVAMLPARSVMTISAEANILAGPVDRDHTVVWDVRAGRAISSLLLPRPADTHLGLTLSPDGKLLATYYKGRSDNTVKLLDVATQEPRTLTIDPPRGNRLAVECAEFSPDGTLLAAGFQFQWVTVWDVATGKVKLQFSQKPSMMCVRSVMFSPDNKALAVGTDVGAVTLWDMESGKLLASFRGHTSNIHALAFSPDGGTLASAGADKTVRLWDVITGQERTTLAGHRGRVLNVQFSPDGSTLATASGDGTIKLWRAATDPEALARRNNSDHPNDPIAAQFNRSAWRLATSDNPGEREPVKAVELAKKAIALNSGNAGYWNTLGVAQYRAADWQAAITALDKAEELAPGRYAYKPFFRAMALWQLGDREQARDCYEGASKWLGQRARHDPWLPWMSLVQCEAAHLLELPAPTPLIATLPPGAMLPAVQLLDSARPFAEKREWSLAAAELNKGFQGHHHSDAFLCFSTALARLLSGDVEGYTRLVERAPPLDWGLDILRMRTMHPRGANDSAALVRFAQSAYDQAANNWSAQNLGMAHYRAGEFDEALRRMKESQQLAEWYVFFPALAMAHHQLGHADEAQQWLDKANAFFRDFTAPSGERLKVLQDDPYWQDWAYFEVMRNEANAVIGAEK